MQLIGEIQKLTGRSLLVYVADFNKPECALKPEDRTGFSDLIQDVGAKRVDILINSPGGFAEVAESLVSMLRSKYTNVRFMIPNMAKSAATLLCFSGNALMLDHRSELGPIDPQVEYLSSDGKKREAAEDIIAGFEEARSKLKKEGPSATPAYVPLLNKLTIGLLRGCENAKKLSFQLAKSWLRQYMFGRSKDSETPEKIARFFSSRSATLSHNRPICIEACKRIGLKIIDLRTDKYDELREKIWELWCIYELHFERSPVYKIYENGFGCTLQKVTKQIQMVQVQPQQPPSPKSTATN